jgi:periplasmic divalent cation tolerance protein
LRASKVSTPRHVRGFSFETTKAQERLPPRVFVVQFSRVKPAARFSIVLVTAPDLKTARGLARGALKDKLVACANLVPKIESHYWWQGKIERGAEVLCVFKTPRTKLSAFEKFVLANHPYDTPEIVTLPLASGTERYLNWIAASVQ